MRPVGIVLALGGMAAVAWALSNLMQIGSCGGDGAPPCPPGSWPYFLALPAGILATVAAVFLGARGLGFAGVFLAVGLGSLHAATEGGVDGDTTFPLVFGLGFLAFAGLPLLLTVFAGRRRRRREELMATGGRGVATVLEVHDTGMTINDDPHVKLRLRVEPHGTGAPFEREKRLTVPRVAIPRPGDRYEVVFDAEEQDELHLGSVLRAAEPAPPEPGEPSPTPPPEPAAEDWVAQLAQLNDLRLKGVLSDDEFTAAKDKLLS